MLYTVCNDTETERLGLALARSLSEKDITRACIAMRGEMGVGKTVFTRGFASFFDISGVRSPTYTIVNEYRGKVNIYHFDLYRISDEDDLYSVGYDEYLEKDGYVILEWSERVPELIPPDAIFVSIERAPDDENKRIITISDF